MNTKNLFSRFWMHDGCISCFADCVSKEYRFRHAAPIFACKTKYQNWLTNVCLPCFWWAAVAVSMPSAGEQTYVVYYGFCCENNYVQVSAIMPTRVCTRKRYHTHTCTYWSRHTRIYIQLRSCPHVDVWLNPNIWESCGFFIAVPSLSALKQWVFKELRHRHMHT